MFLVSEAGYGVYMYDNKMSETVAKRMVQNRQMVDDELDSLTQEPVVALKEEYSNPLDEDTQYSNPFDESEYQNPFDTTSP